MTGDFFRPRFALRAGDGGVTLEPAAEPAPEAPRTLAEEIDARLGVGRASRVTRYELADAFDVDLVDVAPVTRRAAGGT